MVLPEVTFRLVAPALTAPSEPPAGDVDASVKIEWSRMAFDPPLLHTSPMPAKCRTGLRTGRLNDRVMVPRAQLAPAVHDPGPPKLPKSVGEVVASAGVN